MVRARIEGFAGLPPQVAYAYGVIPDGSVQALAALEDLLDAYRDRMAGAPNPQAVTEAFLAEELPPFNAAFGSFFESNIASMQDAWLLRHTWLSTLPALASNTCRSNSSNAGTCSKSLSIPPNSTIEVAIAVAILNGHELAEGQIRSIKLELVDESAR